MALAKNAAEMDLKAYEVTFKGATLGWIKDIDPSGFKLEMVEKKIGELGDIAIDRVITGMSGTIKAVLHQCSLDAYRAVIAGAPGTGAIPLVPGTQYQSMYALAGVLTLHPKTNSGVTEDINLVKAAVVNYQLPKMSDGKNYRELMVEFQPFPDQAQLTATPPVTVYGYVGAIPT